MYIHVCSRRKKNIIDGHVRTITCTLSCLHSTDMYMYNVPVGKVTGGQCLLDMITDDSAKKNEQLV